jgi:hypothetical protein
MGPIITSPFSPFIPQKQRIHFFTIYSTNMQGTSTNVPGIVVGVWVTGVKKTVKALVFRSFHSSWAWEVKY